jgi:cation diffusion facilitator CzcD-associated flavoprotein CzcO
MSTYICATPALEALTRRAREEIALLAYPGRDWVRPASHATGAHVHDVVIVGAGQAGLSIAFGLKRDGVSNVLVLDGRRAGEEGVWENFARMHTLRTPKATIGLEGGIASLSAPAFYKARYGKEAWNAITRVERGRWMEFLRWFRHAAGIAVRNETQCLGLAPEGDLVALSVEDASAEKGQGKSTILARHVVLATGYDGCGAWFVPDVVTRNVSPQRYCHANGPLDAASLKGKRIGILGHGASAFDNASVLLEAGAASVDLCFRRQQLPLINPHRCVEFAGFLRHFHDLDDAVRWSVNRYFEVYAEPPTQNAYDRAHAHATFRLHAGAPWTALRDDGREVHVSTPAGEFTFDYLVCATGSIIDYTLRPELRAIGPLMQRWRHHYTPPAAEASELLGEYPYLGPGFEYLPLDEKDAWLRRVHAFNFSSILSMGPHTVSSSGHKYAVPRVVSGLTQALMRAQADAVMPTLFGYGEAELTLRAADTATRVREAA